MPKPIFVLGAGRSGTSVLTWAIGQHPNIISAPETPWLSALAAQLEDLYRIGSAQAPSGHLPRWGVSRDAFFREFGAAVHGIMLNTFNARYPDRSAPPKELRHKQLVPYRSADEPKARWVDGTPASVAYAMLLADMFPEAKFINLVRSPEHVMKSWLRVPWRDKVQSDAASLLDHVYNSTRAGYLTHAALGDVRAMRVLSEDVFANPEEEIRKILHFLGEDYCPHCLGPLQSGKINSSDQFADDASAEYASLQNHQQLKKLTEWYESARAPEWRIDTPEGAFSEMRAYAQYRFPTIGEADPPAAQPSTGRVLLTGLVSSLGALKSRVVGRTT